MYDGVRALDNLIRFVFFQHNLPEGPPVEDTEGGSGDQEIQEEWVDALPELDTSDPLDQEELLEEEPSGNDLEEVRVPLGRRQESQNPQPEQVTILT